MENKLNSDDAGKATVAMESKEIEKLPCLHVSLKKGENSTVIVWKKLESLGFKVHNASSITTATKLCSTTRMALIVLEDCEEQAFIETIKTPSACNEHTPIVFISSGRLSDMVRHLMQEQLIDELVFKCLTLECDLGSAVARLKSEPGQFAVTPKAKKPVNVRKRKLEAAFPSTRNKFPGAAPAPCITPVLHGLEYAHNIYQRNSLKMGMPLKHQQECYQHKNDSRLPAERMPCYSVLQSCPEPNFRTRAESNEQALNDECAQNMHPLTYKLENPHPQCAYQRRASVIVKNGNIEQSLKKKENLLDVVDKRREETAAGFIEEKGHLTKFKKEKAHSRPLKDSDVRNYSLSLARKGHNSTQMTSKQRSSLPAGQTALERKEQHLDKEKKRRERITKSWHWLRQLVPNCDTYADKATVFEMSVAYLHHCWKYHGPILQRVNKEFVFLNLNNISPEDLERNVTEVLDKERKAFEKNVESSSNTK